MNSSTSVQRMFVQGPKYLAATNVKQTANNKFVLNWFSSTWGKVRESIIENVEKTAVKKKRLSEVEDAAKDSTSTVSQLSKVKNKAQRQLAENWEAIRKANSKVDQK